MGARPLLLLLEKGSGEEELDPTMSSILAHRARVSSGWTTVGARQSIGCKAKINAERGDRDQLRHPSPFPSAAFGATTAAVHEDLPPWRTRMTKARGRPSWLAQQAAAPAKKIMRTSVTTQSERDPWATRCTQRARLDERITWGGAGACDCSDSWGEEKRGTGGKA